MTNSAKKAAQARNRIRQNRIDLGLAISAATLGPGQCRSQKVLAAFCGCTPQAIACTEHAAITKIRVALRKRYGLVSDNF